MRSATIKDHFSQYEDYILQETIRPIKELPPSSYRDILIYSKEGQHRLAYSISLFIEALKDEPTPTESTFATVRLRTSKVRNCFSSKTVVTMAFKLCQSAQKRWIKLYHTKRLADVIRGVKFVNGVEDMRIAA